MLKPPPQLPELKSAKEKKKQKNKEFIWQGGSGQHAEPSSPSRNYTGSGKHSLYLVPFRASKEQNPCSVLAMVGIGGVRLFKEILSRSQWGHANPRETQRKGERSENTSLFVFCF